MMVEPKYRVTAVYHNGFVRMGEFSGWFAESSADQAYRECCADRDVVVVLNLYVYEGDNTSVRSRYASKEFFNQK